MKRLYIITGACGHLGNTIVKKLCDKNANVRCLVMPDEDLTALRGLSVEIIKGDVTVSASLCKLFSGINSYEVIVIHAAGIVSIKTKKDILFSNEFIGYNS